MVELPHDTPCRLHPLTGVGTREMIDGMRGAALWRGFRGAIVTATGAWVADARIRIEAQR